MVAAFFVFTMVSCLLFVLFTLFVINYVLLNKFHLLLGMSNDLSQHKTINQFLFIVGPPSTTLVMPVWEMD